MSEQGNASIAVLGATAVVMVLLLALADLGMFLLARSRAQTAADAAALAAAGEQLGSGDPGLDAVRFAEANGGSLASCDCPRRGLVSTVRVTVGVRFTVLRALGVQEVAARARAEVDLERIRGPRSG